MSLNRIASSDTLQRCQAVAINREIADVKVRKGMSGRLSYGKESASLHFIYAKNIGSIKLSED